MVIFHLPFSFVFFSQFVQKPCRKGRGLFSEPPLRPWQNDKEKVWSVSFLHRHRALWPPGKGPWPCHNRKTWIKAEACLEPASQPSPRKNPWRCACAHPPQKHYSEGPRSGSSQNKEGLLQDDLGPPCCKEKWLATLTCQHLVLKTILHHVTHPLNLATGGL